MIALALIRLALDLTQFAIRLALDLLVMLGRLCGFLLRELVVPTGKAVGEGMISLAGVIAARRQRSNDERWLASLERAKPSRRRWW